MQKSENNIFINKIPAIPGLLLYTLALFEGMPQGIVIGAFIMSIINVFLAVLITLVILITPWPKEFMNPSRGESLLATAHFCTVCALFYYNDFIVQLAIFAFCEFILTFIVPAINKEALKNSE